MGWTLSFVPLQRVCYCTLLVEGAGGTRQRKGPIQGCMCYCVFFCCAVPVTMGTNSIQWCWAQLWARATTLQCTQSLSLVTTLPWPFQHGHMHKPTRRSAPGVRTPTCAHLPASTCLQHREVFLPHQPWLWLLTGWPQFTFNPRATFFMDQLWPGNPTNFSSINGAIEKSTPSLVRSGSHLGSSMSGICVRKWSGITRGAALNKVCLLKYTSLSSLPLLLESPSPAASRT